MGNKFELKEPGVLWVQDVKQLLQDLYDQYHGVASQNEYLREENKKLKDGIWEKEEVKQLKERYEEMKGDYYRGFPISKEEDKKIKKWMDECESENPSPKTTISGRYLYHFYPTSIGVAGTIEDTITKKKLEFQELG